jgi:hypothetical protein
MHGKELRFFLDEIALCLEWKQPCDTVRGCANVISRVEHIQVDLYVRVSPGQNLRSNPTWVVGLGQMQGQTLRGQTAGVARDAGLLGCEPIGV